ncbi:ABC transporter ATP-binding protein [Candidatus Soleaferrea massiliensis]|uniref:ABC transporter ATP-binding protein n=1 Tax=Candidatus Soleaferrea massiliensis TaxID=1470354 RepID=UPI00058C42D5|nr:ABC transporter ATP-binding protein [Candidatus Soleaferrea massiliensis]
MSILSLQNVTYQYEGTKKSVLKDIDAEFETGALYGIMGKSGAGKSTLLSLISGLDLATSGLVSYGGKDMRRLDRDRCRAKDIGVIFQGYNLLTNATAVENIELSMHISKAKMKNKRKAAYAMLERVGIDRETADRKVLKLSGGEQQRVGIARALSHDPALIIADEPTGNLDGDTEENIMGILRDIAHEQGKCVIIVTHSDKVAAHCDVVHHLEKGKLRVVGQ